MDELKKCPFCGRPGERWVDSSGDSDSYVHGCRNCGEMFYGDEGDWNTRPLEDAQAAEIKRLKKGLEFYADELNWIANFDGYEPSTSAIHEDDGDIARSILKGGTP